MRVAGCDYSTRYVDFVTVPYEGAGQPVWHRFPLTGADAFDRARSVADAMPGRASALWDDVLAVGIEHPGGKFGTGDMLRVQGAILSRIPTRMLVHPLPPARWRKQVGLPGNSSKEDVYYHAWALAQWIDPWPQDAADACCIALATRSLIETDAAA